MARILVVDDELPIRVILERALTRAGHEVEVAASGPEALVAQRHGPADLVITDILLPEMDGLELICELRKVQPDLLIMAMSGGGRIEAQSYLESSCLFGADHTIMKPFDIRDVVHLVDDLTTARDLAPPLNGSPDPETMSAK